MTEQEARAAVQAAIAQVAPDIALADFDDASRLRQDLELDSLDFLRLVETMDASTDVDIPERDYASVGTIRGLIDYLAARG
ncbi:phosphopantetheine-binding protein [Arthrobacter alpinus]|uniref:Phosphopantetheine-binding protein n=1 Tax=Arthrobacter alpinus TaxID=656366 RepID=A0A0S2M0G6_9MICC|nr:phosphopantetheine-binding protein [Arthrobacter alpinus]ALO67322.1 phosphopantetheine-binding protein [Arthrobacter alpinus]MDD0857657.1 phosphopantetheine-binding protein [Arthrobacter alpinus]